MQDEFMKSIIREHPDYIKEAKKLSSLPAITLGNEVRALKKIIDEHHAEYKRWLDKYSRLVKKKLIYKIAYDMECGYWQKKLKGLNLASNEVKNENSRL